MGFNRIKPVYNTWFKDNVMLDEAIYKWQRELECKTSRKQTWIGLRLFSKVLFFKIAPKVLFFWFLLQKRIIHFEWGNHNIFLEIWDHVTMNTTTFSKWSSSEIRVSVNLICWADLPETNSISNQNRINIKHDKLKHRINIERNQNAFEHADPIKIRDRSKIEVK